MNIRAELSKLPYPKQIEFYKQKNDVKQIEFLEKEYLSKASNPTFSDSINLRKLKPSQLQYLVSLSKKHDSSKQFETIFLKAELSNLNQYTDDLNDEQISSQLSRLSQIKSELGNNFNAPDFRLKSIFEAAQKKLSSGSSEDIQFSKQILSELFNIWRDIPSIQKNESYRSIADIATNAIHSLDVNKYDVVKDFLKNDVEEHFKESLHKNIPIENLVKIPDTFVLSNKPSIEWTRVLKAHFLSGMRNESIPAVAKSVKVYSLAKDDLRGRISDEELHGYSNVFLRKILNSDFNYLGANQAISLPELLTSDLFTDNGFVLDEKSDDEFNKKLSETADFTKFIALSDYGFHSQEAFQKGLKNVLKANYVNVIKSKVNPDFDEIYSPDYDSEWTGRQIDYLVKSELIKYAKNNLSEEDFSNAISSAIFNYFEQDLTKKNGSVSLFHNLINEAQHFEYLSKAQIDSLSERIIETGFKNIETYKSGFEIALNSDVVDVFINTPLEHLLVGDSLKNQITNYFINTHFDTLTTPTNDSLKKVTDDLKNYKSRFDLSDTAFDDMKSKVFEYSLDVTFDDVIRRNSNSSYSVSPLVNNSITFGWTQDDISKYVNKRVMLEESRRAISPENHLLMYKTLVPHKDVSDLECLVKLRNS